MKLIVLKRDGREEEFVYEKLVVSLLKVGIPLEISRSIARLVECRLFDHGGKASTSDIARWILEYLKRIDKEIYNKWIESYKKEKGIDLEEIIEAKLYYSEPIITP